MKKKRRLFLCCLLTLLLAFVMAVPMSVSAAETETVFTYDGIKYIVVDDYQVKVVNSEYVTGGNSMKQSSYSGDLSIPQKVTYNNEEYSVVGIGEYAFWYSTAKSLVIPESVEFIEFAAFGGSSIENLALPASINDMDTGTFAYYKHSDSVTVSNDNATYRITDGVLCSNTEALYVMEKKEDVTLPSGITTICDWAFQNDDVLKTIKFPDGMTTIGIGAFQNCTGVTEIILPASVTTLAESSGADHYSEAFSGCEALKKVSLPGVEKIPMSTFSDCIS